MGCAMSCSERCPQFLQAFKQQRLSAWVPRRTAADIVKWCAVVGIIFAIISIILTVYDRRSNEVVVRYDEINSCTANHNQGAFSYEGNNMTAAYGCTAQVVFTVLHRMKAPVYLYYGLTKVYQNHRRYLSSQSSTQLRGFSLPHNDRVRTSPLCFPNEFDGKQSKETKITINDRVYKYHQCIYSPAGIIAWSMFNDSFVLYRRLNKASLLNVQKVHQQENNNTTTSINTIDVTSNITMNSQVSSRYKGKSFIDNGDNVVNQLICNGSAFSRATNEPLPDAPAEMRCHKKGIAWTSDVAKRFKPISPPPPSSPPRMQLSSPSVQWRQQHQQKQGKKLRHQQSQQQQQQQQYQQQQQLLRQQQHLLQSVQQLQSTTKISQSTMLNIHDKSHAPTDVIWSAPKDIYYHWSTDVVPTSNDSFYNNGWYANELGHDIPVITDEDFMVWSRVAARYQFRKLYRVIDVDLQPGEYVMHIDEHYDVHSFGGAKFFALTSLTWKGNKSELLIYIYCSIAIICIVNCFLFMCWQRNSEKFALRAIARLQQK